MENNIISKVQFRKTIDEIFLIDLVMEEDTEDHLIEEYLENCLLDENIRYFYRSRVPKSFSFIGELLPNLDERRFRSTVRMSRLEFWKLYSLVKDHPTFQNSRQVPTIVQLLIALNRFGMNGNGVSYLQLAKDFLISDGGTINRITERVIIALLSIEKNWIKWPSCCSRRHEITEKMAEEKLPHCIGFIDGVHVGLYEAPQDDPISYFNRKGFYSMNLLLICDPEKNILTYHVGQPGKVHDSKVFSLTDISRNPENYFSGHEYIIGDSAYRLTTNMITPYRRSQIRNKEHEKFNFHISSRRVAIEHVNGVLKNRFASLKGLRMKINRQKGHKYACEWIAACLILHNMLHKIDPWECDEVEVECDDNMQDEQLGQQSGSTDELAKKKREELMKYVCSL